MKFLVAGLGNIGSEYTGTRHNIGFDAIDHHAGKQGAVFATGRLAAIARYNYKGKQIHLIKPATYMNLSGKALKYWINYLGISIDQVLVIVDDLALPVGTLRLRPSGSDAGHNGLKSIQEELGTSTYSRLRIGIGNEFPKGRQVDYVLGKWTPEEARIILSKMDTISDIINSFCTAGLTNTMNSYNNKES